MTTAIVKKLHEAGLKVALTDIDRIEVWPRERLNDELRTLIRQNKPQLVAWLRGTETQRPPGLTPKLLAASMELDALILANDLLQGFRLRRTPEPKQSPVQDDQTVAEDPLPPSPKPPKHFNQAWHAAAQAYHLHHANNCQICQAAGQGYGLRCGTGAALWATYQSSLN